MRAGTWHLVDAPMLHYFTDAGHTLCGQFSFNHPPLPDHVVHDNPYGAAHRVCPMCNERWLEAQVGAEELDA